MIKGVKTMMGLPTETAYLREWELTESILTVENQHRTKLGPLNAGDSCMGGVECRAPSIGTRIYPYCLYFLDTILFGGIPCSAKIQWESLDPASKQCARFC